MTAELLMRRLVHQGRQQSIVAVFAVVLAVILTGAASCSRDGDSRIPSGAIGRVGDSWLTRSDLRKEMPAGLSAEDSLKFVRAYIAGWVDSRLISELASSDVDMDEIDRLTADYRNELIMNAYRNRMAADAVDGYFAEDSLRAFYEAYRADFVTVHPMVRGVYAKMPADSRKLSAVRKLYTSGKQDDIDRLEKAVLGAAIHYDYFRDRWVDWEQIESRIPYDFGTGGAEAAASRGKLDVTEGGFTYLLEITDYLPAGSAMPFEAALPAVRERMLTRRHRDFDRRLRRDLRERAVADGHIEYFIK